MDCLFETHPDPANAKSDGANMLHLDRLEELLVRLLAIAPPLPEKHHRMKGRFLAFPVAAQECRAQPAFQHSYAMGSQNEGEKQPSQRITIYFRRYDQ